MLTANQRSEFDRHGILRLSGAIAADAAEKMCESVWNALHRQYGIRREAPETWKARYITGLHDLPKSETFQQIGNSAVCESIDDLLGCGNWQYPERWGSLLVTFPNSHEPWDVPCKSWHLDFPASRSLQGLFLVRLFTCLAKLGPGGGGTVCVAGSHRIVQDLVRGDGFERLRSADARKRLIHTSPWVEALCTPHGTPDRVRKFMESSTSFDGELRVVEMTGEPGDIFLTHPLILHAPANNCGSVPRLMLSGTIYRADVQPSALYA